MYWLVASRVNNRLVCPTTDIIHLFHGNARHSIVCYNCLVGSGGVTGGTRLVPLDGGDGSTRIRGEGSRTKSGVVGGGLLLGSPWGNIV